ncbi:hypothetical protein [Chryseobacterium culicis]|uniref:Uncharacterized protein n=1 Tax=Chryseobacterium culicis TaxID=680127 RepID=A0A1H6H6H6_CHRCI|nr:hypothetical protein [Chryseobacterium culicis]SEH29660.1 hypothetical protein SAMN05421593_1136 [Chryseobacterium culicis]
MKELEILKSLLGANFQYNFYIDAIVSVRKELRDNEYYKSKFVDIIKLIIYRQLQNGEAVKLINETANLMLFDNTEEEAYRWLDLFLINVINEGEIIPYEDIAQ